MTGVVCAGFAALLSVPLLGGWEPAGAQSPSEGQFCSEMARVAQADVTLIKDPTEGHAHQLAVDIG